MMFKNCSGTVRGILSALLVLSLTWSIACQDKSNSTDSPDLATSIPLVTTPTVTPNGYSTYIHPNPSCGPYFPSLTAEFYHQHFLRWTRDGSQLIFDASEAIWAVDSAGTWVRQIVDPDPLLDPEFYYQRVSQYGFYADLSPDGTRIAYSTCEFPTVDPSIYVPVDPYTTGDPRNLDYEIAVADIAGTSQRRLTDNKDFEHYPVWSPDGSKIAYIAAINPVNRHGLHFGGGYLFTMPVDGSSVAMNLTRPVESIPPAVGVALYPPVWSPDSQWIAFTVSWESLDPSPAFERVLYTIRADGTELTRIGDTTTLPTWSPDGSELAYAGPGLDGEASAIYAVKPSGSDRQTIWPDDNNSASYGIYQVTWSPTGSDLLFISAGTDRNGEYRDGVYIVSTSGGDLRRVSDTGHQRGWSTFWAPVAAWSPDGSQIAVYSPRWGIETVSRDGSDSRVLTKISETGSPLLPEGRR